MTSPAKTPQNIAFAQNFSKLRLFIWGAACVALMPTWGDIFYEPSNVLVHAMYAACATFVIFVMALGITFYLQRHLHAGVFLKELHLQAQQEASLRLDQLNALLAMSTDGMVAFDAQKRVQFVNPAFVRMTGLSEIHLKGLSHLEFTDLLASRCVAPAVFAGIDVLKKSMTRQRINLAGAGKFVLEVELVKAPQPMDGLDLPLYILLNFRDVTSVSQLEQDKTDFLATAAHELRTPMASVYGFTEVLLTQENSADSQREFLNIIYRQSQHMVAIINDLLDLARIEARQVRDFVFAPLLVQDAIRELIKNFKVPTGRSAPDVHFPAESVLIKADAGKFNQALQNVLSNAYKYSPAGGSVQLSVQLHSDTQVSVSIKDSGIGMTQNQINNVFTRFYRANTVADLPGTGLGMNIVKEIMKLHSGDVLIDSELAVGTRVSLILPVANQ